MNDTIKKIEEGNEIIAKMGRDILALMEKANNGGFFTHAAKLAEIYSHIAKAQKAAERALGMARAVTAG